MGKVIVNNLYIFFYVVTFLITHIHTKAINCILFTFTNIYIFKSLWSLYDVAIDYKKQKEVIGKKFDSE